MPSKLAPFPVGIQPGSSYWSDLYERVRFLVNDLLADLDNYQALADRDQASGYAGLNSASRTTKGVDSTDDLIVDDNTQGLVLKDNAGTPHYWRVTVNSAGTLVITDLGTTKP